MLVTNGARGRGAVVGQGTLLPLVVAAALIAACGDATPGSAAGGSTSDPADVPLVGDGGVDPADAPPGGDVGAKTTCPTALIKVQEGDEVTAQTTLHLVGSQSFASSGDIARYKWHVQQPLGSHAVFMASDAAPDPTFTPNVVGTYIFYLEVWDEAGERSCLPAELHVVVNPGDGIRVELLWHTPKDPDHTDVGPQAGADLDLHFLHPFASTLYDLDGDGQPDPYFDGQFECYWFNPNPNWASHDPAVDDDPELDRDDTDGAGPENVNLNLPEYGLTYRVAVHYWDDHGFGDSFATVRIYIHNVLTFQKNDVQLTHHDLWEVATVAWPSGLVTPTTDAGGGDLIIPNFESPLFPEKPAPRQR